MRARILDYVHYTSVCFRKQAYDTWCLSSPTKPENKWHSLIAGCECVLCVCLTCSVEGEGPASKKPRTTNVVVEQAGQADKLLIDQIADLDSVFEEVRMYIGHMCEMSE